MDAGMDVGADAFCVFIGLVFISRIVDIVMKHEDL